MDGWMAKLCVLPCFQLEAIMVEMQDTKSGVKGSEQKLNVTTIPHVISGETKIQKKNINKPHINIEKSHTKHFL